MKLSLQDEARISPVRTIAVTFGIAFVALYFLVTAIPTGSISQDIAGLGTFKGTSTVSGQCETVVAVSKSYSTGLLSNAAWGPSQFFTETDQVRYTYYSGSGCSGATTSVISSAGPYPVTPAMVQLACGNLPKSCFFYPKFIFNTYNSLYSSVMSGNGGATVPLFAGSLAPGNPVVPTNVVAWEAVTT